MKYIKCLISLAVILSTLQALAFQKSESFARGLMIAVDTRDRRACALTQERVRLMAPQYKKDICEQDGTNPISIVVITIPTNEWDFIGEVDLSRNAPKSVRDQNVGFVSGGNAGIIFILPIARESDNNLRISLKNKDLSVAQMRIAELSLMDETRSSSVSVSFVLKTLPANYSNEQRVLAERMVKRVHISKKGASSEKDNDSTALASLNILDTINTSLQSATNSQDFEIDIYLPDSRCQSKTTCPEKKGEGFLTLLPKSLGFSFTMHF